MATKDLGQFRWRTSSYSGNQGQCVEVGLGGQSEAVVGVRDSKNPEAGTLIVSTRAWARFRATL